MTTVGSLRGANGLETQECRREVVANEATRVVLRWRLLAVRLGLGDLEQREVRVDVSDLESNELDRINVVGQLAQVV